MVKLSAAKRKTIPKQEFGLPDKKKYPMEDRAHAANAKARATQMEKKGKLTKLAQEKIVVKANKILARGKKNK